jgi:sec-independent protein translocase protein TatC
MMPVSPETWTLLLDLALPAAVILALLGCAGLFTADALAALRRYFIVGALLLAAFAASPHVLSQLVLAMALISLYEWSVCSVRLVENN